MVSFTERFCQAEITEVNPTVLRTTVCGAYFVTNTLDSLIPGMPRLKKHFRVEGSTQCVMLLLFGVVSPKGDFRNIPQRKSLGQRPHLTPKPGAVL